MRKMSNLPKWVKKMPKKVTICGMNYKIVYNMLSGASFGLRLAKIVVGCDCTKDRASDALFHEISEIVHCEMGFRTANGRCENGDLRFSLDHQQFSVHSTLFRAALKDCGLIK